MQFFAVTKKYHVVKIIVFFDSYLPDPTTTNNKDPVETAYGSELCAYAFKTWFDNQLGPLTFVRLFCGTLSAGQKIFNVSQEKSEKIAKLYLPFADELREEKEIHKGQVAIVSGLQVRNVMQKCCII